MKFTWFLLHQVPARINEDTDDLWMYGCDDIKCDFLTIIQAQKSTCGFMRLLNKPSIFLHMPQWKIEQLAHTCTFEDKKSTLQLYFQPR